MIAAVGFAMCAAAATLVRVFAAKMEGSLR